MAMSSVTDIVVPLRRGELFFREDGTWIESGWIPLLLRQLCSSLVVDVYTSTKKGLLGSG